MQTRYTIHVQADELKKVIPVPAEFAHQEVEVVISLPRKKHGPLKQYRGMYSQSRNEIDKELKQLRADWERNEK